MAANYRAEVEVGLVTDYKDPDILRALDIYEERIPAAERFEAPDIVRWLREDQEQRALSTVGPRDYFAVAKVGGKVCGFILMHYYSKVQLAFVAYLVVERGVSTEASTVSGTLLAWASSLFDRQEELKDCRGFVFEVDDPAHADSDPARREALARIRLFCMLAEANNLTLRALDFNYCQPPLSAPAAGEASKEVPMLLMYAARTPRRQNWMSKKEVKELVKFIFESLYPEGFSEIQSETLAYRKHLVELSRAQIMRLPKQVPTLNFAQIKARTQALHADTAAHPQVTPVASVKSRGEHDAVSPPVDFVIITPLEEERDAVLSKLKGWRKLPPSRRDILVYFVAMLPVEYPDGKKTYYSVVVVPLANMGQQEAATATADATRRWKPRFVLLVGIAGGLRAAGVDLGDVLIADQVANYELQKLTSEGASIRWRVNPVSKQLLLAARNFLGTDWMTWISALRPSEGSPKRKIGVVCTGDKVIANKLAEEYREVWERLIGVEMEAGGVACAASSQVHPPGFFMIRGVSDLADKDKDAPDTLRWREYACDVAASYAIAMLANGPIAKD
jgi:nucleoside phosphorylase